MSKALDTLKDTGVVTEPKQLADMTGQEIEGQLVLAKKAGLFFYYIQGMILAKIQMDWEVKGGELFMQKYGAETYEEYIERFYDDKHSAQTKIKDFYYMHQGITLGIDREYLFGLQQSDIITQTRRHLQWKHGSEEVQEYAGNVEEVNETLQMAEQLGRNFRKWRKEEESGENKEPIRTDPLTKNQQKAWAFDESLKAMKEFRDSVIGSARKQGIQDCIDIMNDKFEEAKTK